MADRGDVVSEVKRLAIAFSTVDNAFIVSLVDRIIENKFTKQRIKDAINHTIDTCMFPPRIADIISFDRKVKTYTYTEMIALCTPYKTTEDFEMIQVGNKKRWVER